MKAILMKNPTEPTTPDFLRTGPDTAPANEPIPSPVEPSKRSNSPQERKRIADNAAEIDAMVQKGLETSRWHKPVSKP